MGIEAGSSIPRNWRTTQWRLRMETQSNCSIAQAVFLEPEEVERIKRIEIATKARIREQLEMMRGQNEQ